MDKYNDQEHEERDSGLSEKDPAQAPSGSVLGRKTFWRFTLVALLFGAAICIPAARLSLWLDEILQLLLTRRGHAGWAALLSGIAANAGGVPLGYFTQAACIRLLGYSAFSARLPSILSGVFACFGVGMLAVQSRVRHPVMAVLLFCLLPLHIRYAAEARPYEQALCFTIWASVLFLRLAARPSIKTALVYALLIGLAIYTQPFAYFTILAQLFWLTFEWIQERSGRLGRPLLLTALGVLLAGVSFVPWFYFARSNWQQAIAAAATASRIDYKSILVLVHELTGAGYAGSILISGLIVLGLLTKAHSRSSRLFWATAIVMPIALALMADYRFGYFFAIRQLIFVLPALAILAAFGFEELVKNKRVAALYGTAVAATFLIAIAQFCLKPRENWGRASEAIANRLHSPNVCYAAVPSSARHLFEFFDRQLSDHRCVDERIGAFDHVSTVILASSPYPEASGRSTTTAHDLLDSGFQPVRKLLFSKPDVQLWIRLSQEQRLGSRSTGVTPARETREKSGGENLGFFSSWAYTNP